MSPATLPTSALVTLDQLTAAADRLRPVAIRTPLLPADVPGAPARARVWLKPEMLQRGGAFKFRGAYNFLASMDARTRALGVIAPSSGNHAQAVALAASLFGAPATVVMPTSVTDAKRAGAERLGARVVLAGTTTGDRMERAIEIARTEGGTIVPPYDDASIIAGQGTAGLEIVGDLPGVAMVLVPVGGGGLSAGVAAAVKLRAPGARIIGVEPEGAAKLTRARAAGSPVVLESTRSIADGLLAIAVGDLPFAHHEAYLDDVITVSDGAMRHAMRWLLDRMKLVAEPSGAITVAAVMDGRVALPDGDSVLVLSGGNIEWSGLRQLIGDG